MSSTVTLRSTDDGVTMSKKKWESLLRAGKLAEAGAAVGHEIQDRIRANQNPKRGNRRSGWGVQQRERPYPISGADFVQSGGMRRLEHRAAFHAAKRAIDAERRHWLPRLIAWSNTAEHPGVRILLEQEIKRLRRALGVKTSKKTIREQTRRRVQAFRRRNSTTK